MQVKATVTSPDITFDHAMHIKQKIEEAVGQALQTLYDGLPDNLVVDVILENADLK